MDKHHTNGHIHPMCYAARSYIGVPWLDGGRSRTGQDCYGLVINCLKDCGVDIDPRGEYGRKSNPLKMHKRMSEALTVVEHNCLPGDVLVVDRGQIKGVHLAILMPKGVDYLWRAVYVPFEDKTVEVPIRFQKMLIRWAYRIG